MFSVYSFLQIICGQNCTFVIQGNGSVLACGEGSYGRLGQGNSDDLHSLTVVSSLQGDWIRVLGYVKIYLIFYD